MAKTPIFEVEYCIRKENATNVKGQHDAYRKDVRKALVAAASQAPGVILAVLTSNVTLGSGESIDVLHVGNLHIGTEGQVVLS